MIRAQLHHDFTVRVCRRCAQLCWKAESLLLAVRSDNLDAVARYVQAGKDCNIYVGFVPHLDYLLTLSHSTASVRSTML